MAPGKNSCQLNEEERNQILEIITQVIIRTQKREEYLSESEEADVIRKINESMAHHAEYRAWVINFANRGWDYVQYSHLCILVHHFKESIDGVFGVSNYIQANPVLSSRKFIPADPEYAIEICHFLEDGGADTPKFPRLSEGCKWFTEEQMQLCRQQFKRWQKEPENPKLWVQPGMEWTLWCPVKEWNDQLNRWEHRKTGKPPIKRGEPLPVTPAETQQPGNSQQTGGGRAGRPPGQTSKHNKGTSQRSMDFLPARPSRQGTPPPSQTPQHSRVNSQTSNGGGSKNQGP